MPKFKEKGLSDEQKNKIEQKLLDIFKNVYFNNQNILEAKSESDMISEKIRNFILECAENPDFNEVDLLIQAKEKGLELIGNHELIFFEEKIDRSLKMRAFLIPGMKVELTEENASEKVTEDDLQSVDHELCISFKVNKTNKFIKLGNLLDIRANLAKKLSSTLNEKNATLLLKDTTIFKDSLKEVLEAAKDVLNQNS